MSDAEKATEKIARRLAREAGMPESLWQMFLNAAYREYHGLDQPAGGAADA